jgi:PAS domain S-box
MIEIDLRTVFLNYLATNLVCLIVMYFLWFQARSRYRGIGYLLWDVLLQTLCSLLIFLRGVIPVSVSVGISTTLAIAGAVLGYFGFALFVDKKFSSKYNLLLVVIYFLFHIYFAFVKPDLAIRNLIFAIACFIICFQCAWLLLKRVSGEFLGLTANVGFVFVAFCVVNLLRIGNYFTLTQDPANYFHTDGFETFVIVSYQILLVFLVFFSVLMVNKRLLKDIESQEEKFSKAFHSAPYAVMITNLSSGYIIEVNNGFEQIGGYKASEVIGKTVGELELWADVDERMKILDILNVEGVFKDVECKFRRKNKDVFVGEISAEVININNVLCVLSVVNDISSRKRAENQLKESHKLLKKFATHLQTLGEEEKVIIASQIDNELNQNLMALKIDIGLLKQEVQKNEFNAVAEGLLVKLDQSYKTIGSSLKYSLKLMNNFRNEVLYLMGLVEAIKLYLDEFQKEHNINSQFECSVTDLYIDQNRSTTLFKIFQSAMANVAQHSGANEVRVNLGLINGKLQFEISDNGVGFVHNEIDDEISKGLAMMRERSLLLDGDLKITSNTNIGTIVKIEVPYL